MDKLAGLGIDPWSMLLYLMNVGVVLVVLMYFLYKPLMKFVNERQAQIKSSINESQKLKEEFEKQSEKLKKDRKEAEATLKGEIENLKTFTDKKRAELTAEMESARSTMMQKAEKEIEAKKDNLIKDAEEELKQIMAKIILEIVQNKVPEDVIQDSIKSAWGNYAK
jgi:F-type H+-transporting ATPase subunit b